MTVTIVAGQGMDAEKKAKLEEYCKADTAAKDAEQFKCSEEKTAVSVDIYSLIILLINVIIIANWKRPGQ